jgi:phenylacetate-CoA ligase
VLSKDEVIANYPECLLEEGRRPEDLIVSRSSGSSGKVLDIAYDSRAMVTYILAGRRLYQMLFPYRPWHRQVYIYTSPYPLESLFGLYPLDFVSTLAPVREAVDILVRKRPALLVCYPSHLRQIAELASEQERIAMRLRGVSVNSEMSTQAERDYLAGLFHCPVLDEYSSEELTRIAAQCPHKRYHLFEDINYIETLDSQLRPTQGSGTIVGTNLHNFVMPMIRYLQDDRGCLEEGTCPCGRRFRTLSRFEGRRNDSFVLPSGKTLSSGFLLDATYDFLLTYRTAVRDFCLIQRSRTGISLQIVPGKDWSLEAERGIVRRFESFLEPGVTFRVEVVDICEKTKTGKRNPIINLMLRGQGERAASVMPGGLRPGD